MNLPKGARLTRTSRTACIRRTPPSGLTEARALERGVADYGVGFLASSSAEILLRRILALAIHSGTGSWQIAEKIEELSTESPLSIVPESLLKEIME